VLLYQHPDHLATRATTDNSGLSSNQQAHYPYGEGWYGTGTADPSVLKKFTSYEKDTEASAGQLHYALFRTHAARIGRFNRPDPVRGNIEDPQRINRYAYVGGEPIVRTDPVGLWCIWEGVWSASDRICEATNEADAEYAGIRGIGDGAGGVSVGVSGGPAGGDGRLFGTPPFLGGGGGGCGWLGLIGGFFGFGCGGGGGPECKGPGEKRRPQWVSLCNEGEVAVEEWLCPASCEQTPRGCMSLEADYGVECRARGKRNKSLVFNAYCSTAYTMVGVKRYCQCCARGAKR